MICSSGNVRSTARLPETTSKTTIPKLKTSDFVVATLRFWKLSGGRYPIVPPILVVSTKRNWCRFVAGVLIWYSSSCSSHRARPKSPSRALYWESSITLLVFTSRWCPGILGPSKEYSVEASIRHVVIDEEQLVFMNAPAPQPNKISVAEMSHRHQLSCKSLFKPLPFLGQTFDGHHSSVTW
ncbi:hypothetical protein EPI10_020850 [Gossypium australe]|uniref:Uncharacterized protein n=1 Tax=Gossypium australe TaxID=47621 RepID=A0A5B6WF32_9ROSI|nr:hypothetical protein EPI10_020850 [Gossypium australe]